jgi:hypothetical protein
VKSKRFGARPISTPLSGIDLEILRTPGDLVLKDEVRAI